MAYPISDVPRRIVYSGSAGVGPYAFTFEVLAASDIAVYKNQTLLTLTTDYTVSINTGTGTGTVTLVVAATGSDTVTLVGDRAIQRTSDFVTGGDLFANTLNAELDSQTIYAQQIDEKAERALRAPVTDPTTLNMVLPSASVRASKYLAFSSTGDPIATTGTSSSPVSVTMEPFVQASTLEDARTILGISDGAVTAAKLASNSVQSVKIVDEAVTLAKMQHIASSRILGRATAGSGDVEELSATGGLSISAGAISGQLNFQTNRPQPQSPNVAAIDFIDIPSWVRRITVLFNGLSTSAASGGGNVEIAIRIGDAGGLELSAYDSMVYDSGGVTGLTSGFLVTRALLADSIVKGSVTLINIAGNTWVATGVVGYTPTSSKVGSIVGTKTLSDVLTQLRVTTVGGTDAFDAGSVNILYE